MTMRASAGLRQRRRKKDEPKEEETPPPDNQDSTSNDEEPSLWHVFVSHPLGFCLVKVLPIIVIPYGLYIAYLYIRLQHPDWISTTRLRPAVSQQDPRQLLIVGTMSSGTVQVASELKNKLGLEVGHEDSDAEWSFVRDGTVSWFHGIRFFEPLSTTQKLEMLKKMCINYTANMGFHPRMYRSSHCSSRTKWNNCWAKECVVIIEEEWGCAYRQGHGACKVKFEKTLLQVRNPLRTIESLVAKFCQGGLDGPVHPSFVELLEALFPQNGQQDLSCIEAASFYVLNYTNALLEAYQDGFLHGVYKVEETTPCQVARLGGLYSEETTVYKPNHDKVMAKCGDAAIINPAQELMESSSHVINVGLVELTWSDLEGGKHGSNRPEGSTQLVQDVKDLFVKLDYDVEKENDAEDPIFDF